MNERLSFKDTRQLVASQKIGDCSTFALGWDFPYSKFFQDPVGYFRSQGYEIIPRDNQQTGDIVFFSDSQNAEPFFFVHHVAIAMRLNEEVMYLSRLGLHGEIALTHLSEIESYGNVTLVVRPPTPTTYNSSTHR